MISSKSPTLDYSYAQIPEYVYQTDLCLLETLKTMDFICIRTFDYYENINTEISQDSIDPLEFFLLTIYDMNTRRYIIISSNFIQTPNFKQETFLMI